MKALSLEAEGLTLDRVLRGAADGEVVFLTLGDETRYALAVADDGDREVAALRSNAKFMADLTDCRRRARTEPLTTHEEIRAMFDEPSSSSSVMLQHDSSIQSEESC